MLTDKTDVIRRLQQDILQLQGFKPDNGENALGLGLIESAFPNGIFATGAIHEFESTHAEEAAATFGFVSALLSKLLTDNRPCLWVCQHRTLFPLSAKKYHISPDRLIFVEAATDQEVLWVMEEALRCDGLAAVVAEITRVTFAQSRRLQLAVEKSKVTGLLLRSAHKMDTLASIAKWRITPLPGVSPDGFPGVGFPHWSVELLKVRNGRPGAWKVAWLPDGFNVSPLKTPVVAEPLTVQYKVG
jgi:protein ImuA